MAQQNKSTVGAQDLVRGLRLSIIADADSCLPAIVHRLPVAVPDNHVPTVFTLELAPDERGTFLVTCREVPDIVLFEDSEEEALAKIETMILETLTNCRPSPGFPY